MSKWKTFKDDEGKPIKGVRYYLHHIRKHGVAFDKYFAIRFQRDGERIEEGLGWTSEGWTLGKAIAELHELKNNHKIGSGPSRLKAKRAEKKKADSEREEKAMTVSDFWKNDYLHNLETRIKKSSAIKEKQHFEKRIEPAIGKKPLIEITTVDIEKIRDKMFADGFSSRTIQYMIGTFFRIWKHAARRKLVKAGDNPAAGVSIRQANNARTRIITPEELSAILNKLEKSSREAYRITLFCAYTGCRFSEAARLRWENIDFERGSAFFPETKNTESREIFLSEPVIRMLKEIPDQNAGSHIFLTKTDKPYIEPPRPFKTAVDGLKLNEGHEPRDCISFHSLRHTAATYAARDGATLRDLQDMFGWKVPAMVFRYAKGDRAAQKRAAGRLADALTPRPKGAKVIRLTHRRNN